MPKSIQELFELDEAIKEEYDAYIEEAKALYPTCDDWFIKILVNDYILKKYGDSEEKK